MNTPDPNNSDVDQNNDNGDSNQKFDSSRLKRENNLADALLIKQGCPDIPDDFIGKLLFGGR